MSVDGGDLRHQDDSELLAHAADGDTDAFAELYRRHADAAWRAARALLANADDAADAVADAFTRILRAVQEDRGERITHFRAYLLTSTRHAALDRRRGREIAVDLTLEPNGHDDVDTSPTPSELVIDLTDESFVMRAFADLPDRWRRVLWLTEVEGLRPVDAAQQLGMNANAVAQLAYRARSALRERYLQAHVRESRDDACAATVEHLGAYVVGKLGERERRAIDEHLAVCDDCRERRLDLDDVRAVPRRLRALAPIALVGGALRKALDSSTSGMFSGAPTGIVGKAAMVVAGVAVSGSALLDVSDAPPAPPVDDAAGVEEEEPLTRFAADPIPVVEQEPSTTSTTVEPSGAADLASVASDRSGDTSSESTTTTTTTTTTIPDAEHDAGATSSDSDGDSGGDGEGDGDTGTAEHACESDAPGRSGGAPGRSGDGPGDGADGQGQSAGERGRSGEASSQSRWAPGQSGDDCPPGKSGGGPDDQGGDPDDPDGQGDGSDAAPGRSADNRQDDANDDNDVNDTNGSAGTSGDGNRGDGEPGESSSRGQRPAASTSGSGNSASDNTASGNSGGGGGSSNTNKSSDSGNPKRS